MENKRKLQSDSNRDKKKNLESLPNPVVFSTLQSSNQEYSPIRVTQHNTTTQDTSNDLITQDTFTCSSGLIYNNSNSSSSCDLIQLSRELNRKKKLKLATKESTNDDKSTNSTSIPAELSKQKEKLCQKYQDSSDDTDIKELKKRLKTKASNPNPKASNVEEEESVSEALQNSASYHLFCEIKTSLENNKSTDDISSVDGDKSRGNSIEKSSSGESEDDFDMTHNKNLFL
jgi:hypothetical protein